MTTTTGLLFCLFAFSLSAIQLDYSGCQHVVVGGGIGGLYLAHELVNASKYPGSSICVLEAKDRLGGRINSVRNSVDGRLMFEGGGASVNYRVSTIHATIIDAFGLDVACYSYLSPEGCKEKPLFANIRGKFARQNKGYKDSSTFPYKLPVHERFTNESGFVDPWDVNDEQILILNDNLLNAIEGKNRTAAWIALKKVFDWQKANKVPHTNLTFSQLNLRNGCIDPEDGHLYRFSEEYWIMVLDALGESDSAEWLFHASKYSLNTALMIESGTENSVFVDEDGNNLGYSTTLEKLAQNLTAHGGKIHLNHKVTNVKRRPNGRYVITGVIYNPVTRLVANTFEITGVKSVALNMGVNDVKALSGDSAIYTETNYDMVALLDSWGVSPALKGYLHYEDPWFVKLLNLTRQNYRTDGPLRFIEHSQSYPDCEVSEFKAGNFCPAWAQVAYLSGLQYYSYWESMNYNRSDDLMWLSPDDPLTAHFLLEAHRQFVEGYEKLLNDKNVSIDDIPLPDRGVFTLHPGGWAYVKPNNYPVGYMNRRIRQPIDGSPLCIVNNDFSPIQGEAEGSLLAVLEALLLCHNMTLPQIPKAFYDNIVTQFI